jgi:hypothetical protein
MTPLDGPTTVEIAQAVAILVIPGDSRSIRTDHTEPRGRAEPPAHRAIKITELPTRAWDHDPMLGEAPVVGREPTERLGSALRALPRPRR